MLPSAVNVSNCNTNVLEISDLGWIKAENWFHAVTVYILPQEHKQFIQKKTPKTKRKKHTVLHCKIGYPHTQKFKWN